MYIGARKVVSFLDILVVTDKLGTLLYRFQMSVVWNPCYSDQCVSQHCKSKFEDISPFSFFVVNECTLIGTMK